MGRATQGVRLINLEKRNDQIGSVCKVMTESLEDEIPAEEAEGTIVSDPNADVPGYLYDWRSAELAGEESQEIGRHRHAGRS